LEYKNINSQSIKETGYHIIIIDAFAQPRMLWHRLLVKQRWGVEMMFRLSPLWRLLRRFHFKSFSWP